MYDLGALISPANGKRNAYPKEKSWQQKKNNEQCAKSEIHKTRKKLGVRDTCLSFNLLRLMPGYTGGIDDIITQLFVIFFYETPSLFGAL
jgi:hypothetical protein